MTRQSKRYSMVNNVAAAATNEGAQPTSAVWFAAARVAELRTEWVPPPAAGEVQVSALASAISHGTEMLVYRGHIPPDMPLDLPTLAGSFAFPIKYGYAIVGRIAALGSDVDSWAIGDLVFALHPHQGVFNVPVNLLCRLPHNLDPELGVFCANVETALNIAHDTPIRLGETVVVFGQGVVGTLAAQTLRQTGARRVLVVDPLRARRELALRLGADAAFAPGNDLPAQIRAVNNGRLADVALEVSGSPAALGGAIECVMDEGTVVVASWYGTKPVTLELGGRFHRGRLTIRSSQVGRLNPALGPRWNYARRLETAAAMLPHLHLDALVTHRFPLAEAALAYTLVDERPNECGQVLLVYGA